MTTEIVKIQRGRFSPHFQVARAWLSAASATIQKDRRLAIDYIDSAIVELKELRVELERPA
jgi:hypothetical protein